MSVQVNKNEKENPYMNKYEMDMFFTKKLDATPIER